MNNRSRDLDTIGRNRIYDFGFVLLCNLGGAVAFGYWMKSIAAAIFMFAVFFHIAGIVNGIDNLADYAHVWLSDPGKAKTEQSRSSALT